jgi:phosphoribosylformimino-5-aminoimidazole carboxamide ribotide isomerase
VGSALFSQGSVEIVAAEAFSNRIGTESLVAAVDCRDGNVVVGGWKERTGLTVDEVIRTLEQFAGTFLCTLVETEGTQRGIDLAEIARLRALTRRQFIAAGGIRSHEEIDALQQLGADAVVGMAIYTGLLPV